jgi:soluble lytic murein transglycosylase
VIDRRSRNRGAASRGARRLVLLTVFALVLAPGDPLRGAVDDARLPNPAYPHVLHMAEAGRVSDALVALDPHIDATRDGPIAALALRAALLNLAGRHGESAAAWDDVATREEALAGVARRRSAEATLAAGNPAGVVARIGQPTRSGPARVHHDLLIATAGAFRAAGDFDRAADLAGRIATIERRGPLADAARLERAAAQEAAGQLADAIATLRDAQRGFRTPAAFAQARDEERRLANALGRTPVRFSEADYRAIARRLSAAARFAEAIEVLETWRADWPNSSSLDRIDADIIDNLYGQRANEEARARVKAFSARHVGSALSGHVRLVEFRLDVREGRTADAKVLGQALWNGQIGPLSSATRRSVASLLAAYLVSVGDVDGGLAVYRELFRATSGRIAQIDVLWRAGVAAYRAGDFTRAETNLRAALSRRPGPDTTVLASYWLAATEEKLGRRQDAIARFSDLVRQAPESYYGLRAVERLRTMDVAPPVGNARSFPDTSLNASTRNRVEFRAASLWARAGLLEEAAVAARRLAAQVRGDRAATLLAVRASHAAGHYRDGLGLLATYFSRYLEGPADDVPDDFQRLVYPRAFWDEVGPAAAAQQVDPLLMLAIARRESRFDPAARSSAGATGLFQIMPYTAEALAPEAGLEDPDEEGLAHAPTNTALAVALVRRLLDLFDGHPTPAVAAFNAGEDRVSAWWAASKGISEDLFVDTMPYSETRTYVREVYTNYELYKRLYR